MVWHLTQEKAHFDVLLYQYIILLAFWCDYGRGALRPLWSPGPAPDLTETKIGKHNAHVILRLIHWYITWFVLLAIMVIYVASLVQLHTSNIFISISYADHVMG